MIHIVIPVFNRWNFTKPCLDGLLHQSYKDFKIIVVDHGSTDGTSQFIKNDYPSVILLNGDESMWWTAATNLGLEYALNNNAEYVLTLNNDLEVEENYLLTLFNTISKFKPSIVGSVSVDIENQKKISFCGIKWNRYTAKFSNLASDYHNLDLLNARFNDKIIESDMLPGRGVLIPVELIKIIGLYDTVKFPHYGADLDYSLKIKKAGYKLLISIESVVKSHIKETGIQINDKEQPFFKRLKEGYLSIKSPNNLKTRYHLAMNHSPIKVIHFFLDITRIFYSSYFK